MACDNAHTPLRRATTIDTSDHAKSRLARAVARRLRAMSLYLEVARALAAAHSDVGAAECHGMLCGMLSGPRAFTPALWLEHVAGGDDAQLGAARDALWRLQAHTRAALEGGDFDFAPLLPADDAPLAERASAFGAWCRGYLSGFGLAGIADLGALGEDARGFLVDLSRFASVATEVAGDEDDERALAELIEFTRMGVLLVRAQFIDDARDDEADSPVLH